MQITKKDKNFLNFHSHTSLSIRDALNKPKDLVKAAKELGHTSCCVSEHGHMASFPTFVKECEKEGIQFRLGVELYFQWEESKKESRSYHLLCIVKNEVGYQNLLALQALSSISVDDGGGFYKRARVTEKMLLKHKEGLIFSSACLSGPVTYHLEKGDWANAMIAAEFFRDNFDHFYLEIMPHRLALQAKVNPLILELGKKTNIPVITTLDVHIKDETYANAYLANGDLRRDRTISYRNDPNADCLRDPDFWFKCPDEIISIYEQQGISKKDIIDSFKNTLELDKLITFKWEKRHFDPPSFCEDADKALEKLIAQKLKKKYPNEIPQQIKDRLRYEFNTIRDLGYSNYFLILNDAMEFCDSNGINRGIGRGSAGACLVLYILGITKINPLDYDLAFSRFLNPYRKSYPDVDLDLDPKGRVALVQYLQKRWGKNRIVKVATYSEMRPRAAISDAGKWLEIPFDQVKKITTAIPSKGYDDDGELVDLDWDEAMEHIPDNLKIEYAEMLQIAERLSGSHRQFGTHAGAVCVLPEDANKIIPIMRPKADEEESGIDCQQAQYDKKLLESIGIHKYDLLGLQTLTVLKELEELTGIKNDDVLENHLNDKKTWKFFQEAKYMNGIFQFTEPKSKKFLREIKPTRILHLSDTTTLIRPGADSKKYFENKKSGKIDYQFNLPEIKEELDSSYGGIIYQEQLINLFAKLSGMDLGEADLLRRAVEKGKKEEIDKYKEIFYKTCKYPEIKEDLFDWLKSGANYNFCKPHGVGYSIISYYCGFYKSNFPEEFLIANIRHPKQNNKFTKNEYIGEFVNEAKQMGTRLSLPVLGGCFSKATKQNGVVYLGLDSIKGITEYTAKIICKIEANDLLEFIEKSAQYTITTKKEKLDGSNAIKTIITKAHILSLIKIGFFGNVKENLEKFNEHYSKKEKKQFEPVDVNIDFEDAVNQALGFDFFNPLDKHLNRLDKKYKDEDKYIVIKVTEVKEGNTNGRKWIRMKGQSNHMGEVTSFMNSKPNKGDVILAEYSVGKSDAISIKNWKLL